jgi:hypothetical protein
MSDKNYGQNGFLVTGASATQGPFYLVGGKYGVIPARSAGTAREWPLVTAH